MKRPTILASVSTAALLAIGTNFAGAQTPLDAGGGAYPPAGMTQPPPGPGPGGMGQYPAPQPLAPPAPQPPAAQMSPYPSPALPPSQPAGPGPAEYPPAGGMTAPAAAAQAQSGAPDEAFAGLSQQEFYDLDGRIGRIEQRAQTLPRPQRRKALAELHSIRGEEAFRKKRKGGDLKDWDLEFLHGRLNRLVQRYPALGQ